MKSLVLAAGAVLREIVPSVSFLSQGLTRSVHARGTAAQNHPCPQILLVAPQIQEWFRADETVYNTLVHFLVRQLLLDGASNHMNTTGTHVGLELWHAFQKVVLK